MTKMLCVISSDPAMAGESRDLSARRLLASSVEMTKAEIASTFGLAMTEIRDPSLRSGGLKK
jgi:hypothetical protein